ncbi:hypothetical protein [Nitrobacter winogradskyi]|uniref:Uncharacterized protein n=1 Tax=Nitrobacter winogradskyi TaxID=913 RepID=A0ACC6ALX1_NITWI|nr:hypothetical protein [Nitrobacter winogradskyi]MCP2000753.1 hypothetical protein [Nitrobacter winogradskyi]
MGLRKSGRDGRIGWRPGLRETRGIVTADHLLSHSGIDAIRRIHTGEPVGMSDLISVNPWPRSVMIDGQAVLLVEPTENPNDQCQWQLVPKDILLEFSGWAIGDAHSTEDKSAKCNSTNKSAKIGPVPGDDSRTAIAR